MARRGPLRPVLVYRDRPERLRMIDAEAERAGLTRTDYLLQLVAWARANMPDDWPTPADRIAPKPGVAFREDPLVVAELNGRAAAAGVTREELISRLVSYAREFMPADAPVPEHGLDRRRGERFAPGVS